MIKRGLVIVLAVLVLGYAYLSLAMEYKAKNKAATGGSTPPVVTGTGASFNVTNAANTGSGSITIPNDATMAICVVSAYASTTGFFSGGTVTLGGSAMTAVTGGDASASFWMGSLFWLANANLPDGSTTLAWDWSGTGNPTDHGGFFCGFYKGVDTSAAVRSSSCTQQGANTHRSGTLTAQTGDTAVGFPFQFASAGELTFTFTATGADFTMTKRQDFTRASDLADAAYGDATPTANGTVGADASTSADGGICALILKPAP